MKYLFIIPFLRPGVEAKARPMAPEYDKKWETECLNTRFPLPILMCAGYSLKLIFYIFLWFDNGLTVNEMFVGWNLYWGNE